MSFKVNEVYCFISVGDDGEEGIIIQKMPIGDPTPIMPFVCTDKKIMELIRPLAMCLAKEHGVKIKLIKLTHREELEEF